MRGDPMNRDQFSGKWHELKGKVKEKWGKLTDDDITQVNGKFEQLMGKLQHKYGWSKEQAEREINSWCASCEGELKGHKTKNEQWDREQSQWREGEEEQDPHKHKGPDMKDKKRKAG